MLASSCPEWYGGGVGCLNRIPEDLRPSVQLEKAQLESMSKALAEEMEEAELESDR